MISALDVRFPAESRSAASDVEPLTRLYPGQGRRLSDFTRRVTVGIPPAQVTASADDTRQYGQRFVLAFAMSTLCELDLFRQKHHRRLGRRFIDIQLHFTVLALFGDGCGIVRTAAAGDHAGIKNTRFCAYNAPFVGNTDNHRPESVIEGMAARRQSLLQGQLFDFQLFDFLPEDVVECRTPPGVQRV
jgi:hypothetical protein